MSKNIRPGGLGRTRAGALALAVLGTSLAFLTVTPASAGVKPVGPATHAFGAPIYSGNIRGNVTMAGNVTTTCSTTFTNNVHNKAEWARRCNAARDGAPITNTGTNNSLWMNYVQAGAPGASFASSSARVSIPAGSTVMWAGLHWNAMVEVPTVSASLGNGAVNVAPVNRAARHSMRLAGPDGSYQTITADDAWDNTNPSGDTSYSGYADVTSLVTAKGSGLYSGADVQSCTGFGGCFASWSLQVVYANPTMAPRNINVWHGWELTAPSINGGEHQFSVTGLQLPPSGAIDAEIGVVAADGDRGQGPDSLEISSPSSGGWHSFATPQRPMNAVDGSEFFDSTINYFSAPPAGSNPSYRANLNADLALVRDRTTLTNSDTSLRFRVKTTSTENLFNQVVLSSVPLYRPEISVDKTASPAKAVNGDTVTWTLRVKNAGIDDIRKAVIRDPLPAGIEPIANTVKYIAGGPASILGAKTDTAGDDQADYDPATRTFTFRVGSGANPSVGGLMGIAPATDGSDDLTITFQSTFTAGPGITVTNTGHAYGEGRALEDGFGPITTTAKDPASVAGSLSDLGVSKTASVDHVTKVGDTFSYQLLARNAGPDDEPAAVITDPLPRQLAFVSSADGCIAAGQAVTCSLGALAAGASITRTITVRVVELPAAGHSIDNVATIGGQNPNPDCVPATPTALCNHDDEHTPAKAPVLKIVKTTAAVAFAAGDTLTYQLHVTNTGTLAEPAAVVTDTLRNGLEYVSSTEGGTYDTANGTVTWPATAIGLGEAFDRSVTVKVPDPVPAGLLDATGKIPNTAKVHGDLDCVPGPSEDGDCRSTVVIPPKVVTPANPPVTTPNPPQHYAAQPSAPPTTWASLPHTGAKLAGLVALGVTLLAAGATLVWGRGRRRGQAN